MFLTSMMAVASVAMGEPTKKTAEDEEIKEKKVCVKVDPPVGTRIGGRRKVCKIVREDLAEEHMLRDNLRQLDDLATSKHENSQGIGVGGD